MKPGGSSTRFPLYIAHVSTWKWQELLLARDLQEETLFAAAFNFILKRLPLRRTEACFLAKGFWGDSQAVIPHLAEENQVVFLTELTKAKEEGAALVLWRSMVAGRFPSRQVAATGLLPVSPGQRQVG